MRIIGLTGGIGSGKSTVARLFGELGVHWVDADNVAREVVEPGQPALAQIAEHFGAEVLQADGSLNRAWLRERVFAEPAEREWLEQLLHPVIREELVRQLRNPASLSAKGNSGDYPLPYVLLVSPLLLETNQHQLVEQLIVVDVPEEVQLERTMARDANTREQVERIMAAQLGRDERRARASAIIDNNRPLDNVELQVCELHNRLLAEFS
ncbi:dephospho-CoA kinase [uncultured Marinobacter sp.]|uniref:dephospho-CoA kinase n=1 Tax=uncultured Marinobacter sp. TaxID=187379 RepID=UPI00258DCE1B|nr:dephospho-CoA kinase [uncultured Marinobacter sp.]